MGGRRTEGGKLGERAKARLQEAHALLADGAHGDAAAAFDEMAGIALGRDMPRVACRLAVRGAQGHAHAGDAEAMRASAARALEAARLDNDKSRSARTFGDLVATLRETGQDELAEQVAQAVREGLGAAPRPRGEPPTVNRAMRRNLPKRCDGCGVKVDADRVEWNDDGSVDCGVCGSTL